MKILGVALSSFPHLENKFTFATSFSRMKVRGNAKMKTYEFVEPDITIKVSRLNIQNIKTNVKKKGKFSSNRNSFLKKKEKEIFF